MAIVPITLPKWGLEMSEGTVTAWHLAEGASGDRGAELVDIETEKIVNTVELDGPGTLRRRLAAPGDTLPVGALIAVLAPASVPDAEIDAFIAGYRPIDVSFEPNVSTPAEPPAAAPSPPPAPRPALPAPSLAPEDLARRNETAHASPIARKRANQLGIDLTTLTGTGTGGRISQDDVEAAARTQAESPPAEAAPAAQAAAIAPADLAARNEGAHASPIARKLANQLGIDLTTLTGTGKGGRISQEDVEAAAGKAGPPTAQPAAPPPPSPAPPSVEPAAGIDEGPQAGPAARRLAREGAIDLSRVPASAPKGRVGKEDVQAYILRHALPSGQAGSFVPHSSMRRTMAAALTRAKQAVPHFYTAMDVRLDALLALRGALNSPGAEVKVSVNDVLLKAVAMALRDVPEVNAHVADDGVHRFPRADIAFAVAIEGGLLTPVIRDVTGKSLAAIARESQDLAEKARSRRLAAEDIKGATFTVSNLGMFGVRSFDAIISPPQAAILAVGGVRREPHEGPDGGLVFHSVATVTLSADHRAIDGAVAARFLQAVRTHCEAPAGLTS